MPNTTIHGIVHNTSFVHGLSLPAEWILASSSVIDWRALTLVVGHNTTTNYT